MDDQRRCLPTSLRGGRAQGKALWALKHSDLYGPGHMSGNTAADVYDELKVNRYDNPNRQDDFCCTFFLSFSNILSDKVENRADH